MRLAALYDIHGNLPALEAVVAELQRERIDQVVIGGDVLPGPMPVETLRCLRALPMPVQYLRGNGDREVLAMRAGHTPTTVPARYHPMLAWNAAQLSDEHARFISEWPPTIEHREASAGSLLFCHATPDSDTTLFTSASSRAHIERLFAEVSATTMVCGHTHHQFRCQLTRCTLLNAGSVGMAISARGAGFAEWLVLDDGVPQFRSTPYDIAAAAERIRATSCPLVEEFLQQSVLSPPLLHDVIALYTRAAEP